MTTLSVDGDEVELNLIAGDDETFSIQKNDDGGNAQDISGWTFYFTVKDHPQDDDADAVIQKSVSSHVDAANGKTRIDVSASDTQDLSGNYWYDMVYERPNGKSKTFMHGNIYFETAVTHSA